MAEKVDNNIEESQNPDLSSDANLLVQGGPRNGPCDFGTKDTQD